jgi:hypothetical protein
MGTPANEVEKVKRLYACILILESLGRFTDGDVL